MGNSAGVVDEVVSASSGSKKKLNQEIGGELIELTRAVVKKAYVCPGERVQVSSCSTIPYVIEVSHPMEQKHCAQAEAKNKWLSSLDRQVKATYAIGSVPLFQNRFTYRGDWRRVDKKY